MPNTQVTMTPPLKKELRQILLDTYEAGYTACLTETRYLQHEVIGCRLEELILLLFNADYRLTDPYLRISLD